MPHYTKHLINHLKSCHPESSVLLAETGQKNECSYCGKIFKYNYSMKKHVESLHEAPTVPCHICGILLKGQKTLTSHLKSVHEKTVRHHCPEPGCTMTAVNSHHLKVFVSKIYFTNIRLSNVRVYPWLSGPYCSRTSWTSQVYFLHRTLWKELVQLFIKIIFIFINIIDTCARYAAKNTATTKRWSTARIDTRGGSCTPVHSVIRNTWTRSDS